MVPNHSIMRGLIACGICCLMAVVCHADSVPTNTQKSYAKSREHAVSTLRGLLTAGHGPNVHAAEALIWDGYPQGIRKQFLKETSAPAEGYRVLVYRVLAQCSDGKDRKEYIEKIRKVAVTPGQAAAENAIESLGKLGYAGRDPQIVALAKQSEPVMQILARWVLANGGRAEDEHALADMLDVQDSHTRGIAAYALRFLKHVRPETVTRLQDWLAKEPENAGGRVFLACALYVHGPESSRESLKKELLRFVLKGNPEERYQAGLIVGTWANASDLPTLEPLLAEKDSDVCVAAAHAILMTLRHLPYN